MRQLGRNYAREAPVFFKIDWFDLFENLKIPFKRRSLFFQLVLLENYMLFIDILFVALNNITLRFDLSYKYYVMAWFCNDILYFKIFFMKDSILLLRLRLLSDLICILFTILGHNKILIILNITIKLDHPVVLIKINVRLLLQSVVIIYN